ncbi:MAG TPA: transposase [Pyrinomonadaceae bacterium]|jgi:transposase
MDAREQRGLEIANTTKLKGNAGLWLVPSSNKPDGYTVEIDKVHQPRCSCPDYSFRFKKCKHIFAVEFTIERKRIRTETKDGQTTVTETTETVKVKRTTYRQEWKQYNAAQAYEKSEFLALLYSLANGIEEPLQTFGRPRLSMSDTIFAIVYKIYSTVSTRRFATDLRDAHQKGYLSKLPSYSTLFDYLKMEELTPYLKHLITESGKILKSVEVDFAVDSSGFSTSQFGRWFVAKYGGEADFRKWIKLHAMVGTKTNVVTSVEISTGFANDSPYFKGLVDSTVASGFKVAEVSADKAYLSKKNMLAVTHHGATPYIPFKSNTQPSVDSEIWNRMYYFYRMHNAEFEAHYHKRSNVETTFHMIKSKFGERLRGKTETAQINEVLAKVLCHNICCVVQSIHELGIEATFHAEMQPARKVG